MQVPLNVFRDGTQDAPLCLAPTDLPWLFPCTLWVVAPACSVHAALTKPRPQAPLAGKRPPLQRQTCNRVGTNSSSENCLYHRVGRELAPHPSSEIPHRAPISCCHLTALLQKDLWLISQHLRVWNDSTAHLWEMGGFSFQFELALSPYHVLGIGNTKVHKPIPDLTCRWRHLFSSLSSRYTIRCQSVVTSHLSITGCIRFEVRAGVWLYTQYCCLEKGLMILPSQCKETHSDMGKGAGAGWSELCERHVVNVTPVRVISLWPQGKRLRSAVTPARVGVCPEPPSIQPAKEPALPFLPEKGLASSRLPFKKLTKQKGRLSFDSGKILFICCMFRKRTAQQY